MLHDTSKCKDTLVKNIVFKIKKLDKAVNDACPSIRAEYRYVSTLKHTIVSIKTTVKFRFKCLEPTFNSFQTAAFVRLRVANVLKGVLNRSLPSSHTFKNVKYIRTKTIKESDLIMFRFYASHKKCEGDIIDCTHMSICKAWTLFSSVMYALLSLLILT